MAEVYQLPRYTNWDPLLSTVCSKNPQVLLTRKQISQSGAMVIDGPGTELLAKSRKLPRKAACLNPNWNPIVVLRFVVAYGASADRPLLYALWTSAFIFLIFRSQAIDEVKSDCVQRVFEDDWVSKITRLWPAMMKSFKDKNTFPTSSC